MGKTQDINHITGRYPTGSQIEITIGDGTNSSGEYIAASGVLNTAVTSALADLKATGGIIRILPGSYSLDADLAVNKDNILILGSGYNTTISTGAFSIRFSTTADIDNIVVQSARWITASGPCLVFGSTGFVVSTSMVLENWFSTTIADADPNTGLTPAPTYLFKLDEVDTPYASGVVNYTLKKPTTGGVYPTASTGNLPFSSDNAQLFNETTNILFAYDDDSGTALRQLFPTAAADDYSIEFFVKHTGDDTVLITQWDGAISEGIVVRITDGKISIQHEAAGDGPIITSNTVLTPEQWYLVTITKGTGTTQTAFKIYTNGIQDSVTVTTAGTITGVLPDGVFALGAIINIAANFTNAENTANYIAAAQNSFYINNVAIFSEEIDSTEVLSRYIALTGSLDIQQVNTIQFITNGNISLTTASEL